MNLIQKQDGSPVRLQNFIEVHVSEALPSKEHRTLLCLLDYCFDFIDTRSGRTHLPEDC